MLVGSFWRNTLFGNNGRKVFGGIFSVVNLWLCIGPFLCFCLGHWSGLEKTYIGCHDCDTQADTQADTQTKDRVNSGRIRN